MAYSNFAYYYDDLNQAADYDALCTQVLSFLRRQGIQDGIVADLGCGTGEMSLRLADAGYDMIAVDASEDMLAVAREKAAEENSSHILFLRQDLAQLDLYGTIRAAVATFDTLNHLSPQALAVALQKISLFMEPGGMFIFDANTPYKHSAVLANNTFEVETEDDLHCTWKNTYRPELPATEISVAVTWEDTLMCEEHFLEYCYTEQQWRHALQQNGFEIAELADGETFGPLIPESQRFLIVAVKSAAREQE